MRLPPERRLDVLALCGQQQPMRALLAQLVRAGFGVDVANGLGEARTAFFGAGGVHCVLVGPDVAPGMADRVIASLRSVDPDLPAVTFGPKVQKGKVGMTAVLGFHPGSRAGVGALLRFLRALPERA